MLKCLSAAFFSGSILIRARGRFEQEDVSVAWGPSATDIVAEPERTHATAVAEERWPRIETKMATVFDKHIEQKP